MQRLVDALGRQRARLKSLLIEADVPVEHAEGLLLDALSGEPWEAWTEETLIDGELVRAVSKACRRFAASSNGPEAGFISLLRPAGEPLAWPIKKVRAFRRKPPQVERKKKRR
jgi:hypothetical protein